jgi:hypothetical protein
MSQHKSGPNSPCPCGSGRKLKRCCQSKASSETPPSRAAAPIARTGGKFRFEPGSYGGKGMFAPSIACLKQVRPDDWADWAYHFVLAKPDASFGVEQAAVDAAKEHLEEAFAERRRTGTDAALASYLKRQGYLSIEGFKVIEESGEGQEEQ